MSGEDKAYVAFVYVTAVLSLAMIALPVGFFLHSLLVKHLVLIAPTILMTFLCGFICARASIHAYKQAGERVREYD
jgi:O-antigen/teichoic acid export membrane protein